MRIVLVFIPYEQLLEISSEYNLFHALEHQFTVYLRNYQRSRRIVKSDLISYDQLNDIAIGNEAETNGEFVRYLILIFEDLGVVIGNPCEIWISINTNQSRENIEDQSIDEALNFLSSLLCQTDNPLNAYLKQMGSENLLSKQDEEFLGKKMAEGRMELFDVISESPIALNEILLTASAVKNGELPMSALISKEICWIYGYTVREHFYS